MDFNRIGLRCYSTIFPYASYSLFIHSPTPYSHPRLDCRIEPKFSNCQRNGDESVSNEACGGVAYGISTIPLRHNNHINGTQFAFFLLVKFFKLNLVEAHIQYSI